MAYKIEVTPHASEDLEEIVSYIEGTLANAAAAAAFLDAVEECYDELEAMPFLFEECRDPQLKALGYRRAVIKHYVMVYRVDEAEKTVYILRFFYGAREYEKLI
ncbi:MAG: type II toxin-antitoxin system RelE/ParE family toxin [Oscillospiraceae bacterium]|nr:type II toxin-antitoxin system RelE/ParE family toxin [Oscillospiraceae bacterium]